MEKTPKELLKAYVDSQEFHSTTQIMDAMKEMFAALNITHIYHAAAQRNFTIELLKAAKSEEERGAAY